VAVAVSASIVAEEVGQTKAVAFTAGLLHDIGKLVLASAEGESYARIIQRAKDERLHLSAVERSAFVIDHAELGGELMHRWNLPPDVVAAVRHHHELETVPPYEQLTAVIQVADMVAHQFFAEDLANTDLLTSSTTALDTIKLNPAEIPRLLSKIQTEMENLKGLVEKTGP
jgi:putative nucleotidyltransferase with HDIG domain